MSSISKTDQLSARVSVKVPHPDSMVEVRVTPPDSTFQVKVSPGDEVIELLIQPGASMVEVRISPPGEMDSKRLAEQFSLPSEAHFQRPEWGNAPPKDVSPGVAHPETDLKRHSPASPPLADEAPARDEVLPGVSRAEFAAMIEEEESAEAKKLLDQMAEDEEAAAGSRPAPGYQLPDEVKEILESDDDDEEELNRLDEFFSPVADENVADGESQEMVEAPAADPAPEESPEAQAGPAPDDLLEVIAPAEPTLFEPDDFDQSEIGEPADEEAALTVAPADLSLDEPDEFDLPDVDEPADDNDDDETDQTDAPADLRLDEPDEFDLPDVDEPADDEDDEAAQTDYPADLRLDEPDEFDLPDIDQPADEKAARSPAPAEPGDAELKVGGDKSLFPDEQPWLKRPSAALGPIRGDDLEPPVHENGLEALTLENDEIMASVKSAPAATKTAASASTEPSASQTMQWVPVSPAGTPVGEDEPIDPEVIGAAALDALARLNMAVQEEQAAMEAAIQPMDPPRSGEATAAAAPRTGPSAAEEQSGRQLSSGNGFLSPPTFSYSSADSTIMVEMYDDYEPGPNPADTITPPPEDELMDLSQVEKDEELAIDPIDVDGLGELDLEKSHFAETKNGTPTIKARPMVQVIPGNTVVPE